MHPTNRTDKHAVCSKSERKRAGGRVKKGEIGGEGDTKSQRETEGGKQEREGGRESQHPTDSQTALKRA